MNLTWAYLTDTGMQRGSNEDATLALVTNLDAIGERDLVGLFAVSDGMGGKEKGEVAAKIAVKTLGELFLQRALRHNLGTVRDVPGYSARVPDEDRELMENPVAFMKTAIQEANRRIFRLRDGGEHLSMGATLTAAIIRNDVLTLGHVGDCRCYFLDQNSFRILTQDHSMVCELVKQGVLTEEEARVHPRKNILSRSLGSKEEVEVDTFVTMIPRGIRLMICTDGLYNMVTDETIRNVMCRHAHPKEQAAILVKEANLAGGKDNVTAMMIHFH